ncbi:hypothetical protein ACPVPU_12520 [Sphingomonas sp. CJ99]
MGDVHRHTLCHPVIAQDSETHLMNPMPKLFNWSGRFADLDSGHQNAIAQLIQEGGAINGTKEEILLRLQRTRKIAVLSERENGRVVGVAALKTPTRNYRQKKFTDAGFAITGFEKALELGYIVTHADWRGHQLSGGLIDLILHEITAPAFATTDSDTMRKNLTRSGFTRVGRDWQGNKGALSLWIFMPT